MSDQEYYLSNARYGSFKAYVVGFGLMLVLSAATFALAMTRLLPVGATTPVILVLAAAQIGTLLVAFLRLERSSEEDVWTLVTSIYTVIVLAILVGATVWIMYHLSYNTTVNLQ